MAKALLFAEGAHGQDYLSYTFRWFAQNSREEGFIVHGEVPWSHEDNVLELVRDLKRGTVSLQTLSDSSEERNKTWAWSYCNWCSIGD